MPHLSCQRGHLRALVTLGTLLCAAGLAACDASSRAIAPVLQSPSADARGRYLCNVSLPASGSTSDPSVTCVPARSMRGLAGRSGTTNVEDVVLDSQGVNVQLTLSSFAYSHATHIFSTNCTVQNLLTQPIGTTDGSTTTAAGVRVYFTYGPVPNDGIGTAAVKSPDGDTLFQGQTDPYFEYTPFINPQATSAAKKWSFQLSANATGFNFEV